MHFKDRTQAGKLLAQKLGKYKGTDVVVYALPRGGVIPALEIATYLHAPLDLIITRKIGHPHQPEYAIAAITEQGDIIGDEKELAQVSTAWVRAAIEQEKQEIQRRKHTYLKNRKPTSAKGKIAILVDDGVATGLTLRAGIKTLQRQLPQKIVIAIPLVPKSVSKILKTQADEVIALTTPPDEQYLGSVGAYYDSFPQINDEAVIRMFKERERG